MSVGGMPTSRCVDPDTYNARVCSARAAALLPRPPILRRENIFATEAYRKVVVTRRLNLLYAEAQKRRARLEVSTDPLQCTMQSALRSWEDERQRQKLWMVIEKAAAFLSLFTKASEVLAFHVLKRLFAPIVRRVRARMRRNARERTLMSLAHAIPQLTPCLLAEKVKLFADWPAAVIGKYILPHVKPRVAAPRGIICAVGTEVVPLHILCSGVVEIYRVECNAKGVSGTVHVAYLSECFSTFDDMSVITGTPPEFGARSAGRGRVLYWTLPRDVFISCLNAVHPTIRDKYLQRVLSERRLTYIRLRYPPSPQAIINCGRNRLFLSWQESDLQALCKHLTPAWYPAGELIFHQGDAAAFFVFVVDGLADVYVAHSAGDVGTGVGSSATVYGRLVATVGTWCSVGEESIASKDVRLASVVAKTDVGVWRCERQALLDILATNVSIYIDVKRQIAGVKADRMKAACDPPTKALRSEPLLALCHEETLVAMALRCQPLWVAPHEALFDVAQPRTSIIIVVSGHARLRSTNRKRSVPDSVPRVIGSGAVIGAASAVLREPWFHAYVYVACTAVEAWELTSDDLHATIEAHEPADTLSELQRTMKKRAAEASKDHPVSCTSTMES